MLTLLNVLFYAGAIALILHKVSAASLIVVCLSQGPQTDTQSKWYVMQSGGCIHGVCVILLGLLQSAIYMFGIDEASNWYWTMPIRVPLFLVACLGLTPIIVIPHVPKTQLPGKTYLSALSQMFCTCAAMLIFMLAFTYGSKMSNATGMFLNCVSTTVLLSAIALYAAVAIISYLEHKKAKYAA